MNLNTITAAGIRLLPTDRIETVRAQATTRLQNATGADDKRKWSALLFHADAELQARKRSLAGDSDSEATPEGEGLAERLQTAKDALYGPERSEASIRAEEVRREMRGR